MHCSDPLPPVSIKQDKKKASLSREGTKWKIPPSVAKQTAWGPEDACTNLALFRRITALYEESLGFGEAEGIAKALLGTKTRAFL